MEENKNTQVPENLSKDNNEEVSFFNFNQLFQTFILNWQWFALSLIIALDAKIPVFRQDADQG